MKRTYAIILSIAGLAGTTFLLVFIPSSVLAYVAMLFLALVTGVYLLPSPHPGKCLVFPRSHPFFRYMQIATIASVPLTFLFVYFGISSVLDANLPVIVVLGGLRLLPGRVIEEIVHRLRRKLLVETAEVQNLSGLKPSPMSKVTGYIFGMRKRRRLLGETAFNVWLIDESYQKIFLTSVSEIRGITEPVREGARLVAVGPSEHGHGIKALQPAVSLVLKEGWAGSHADWLDQLWRKTLRRRLLWSVGGSMAYVIAMGVLGFAISGMVGRTGIILGLSLFSALFFGLFSIKGLKEGAVYDVEGYFEPTLRGLPDGIRNRRLRHLRGLADSGHIPEEYILLLEKAGPLQI